MLNIFTGMFQKDNSKRIFITGGLGYLGSHFAREAVKVGHTVMLYDSLIYEQDHVKMMEEINEQALCECDGAQLVIGDTRNTTLLRKSIESFKPDYVMHFAEFGSVYAANHNPRLTFENNYLASIEVLKICEEMGIKVIYNSSSSLYGTQKGDKFMKEDDEIPTPTDEYVKNKIRMEKYIEGQPNLDIIVFRPATVFGTAPRLRIDLLSNHFTYMAIAKGSIKIFDGNAYRACIDIDELTKAYLRVIEVGKWNHRVYNIGHHNMTKNEYAKGVQNVIKCELDSSSDITDPRNLRIDCSRFYDEFNWTPVTPYEDSISKVANWIHENQKEIEDNKFIGILTMPFSEWERMCK